MTRWRCHCGQPYSDTNWHVNHCSFINTDHSSFKNNSFCFSVTMCLFMWLWHKSYKKKSYSSKALVKHHQPKQASKSNDGGKPLCSSMSESHRKFTTVPLFVPVSFPTVVKFWSQLAQQAQSWLIEKSLQLQGWRLWSKLRWRENQQMLCSFIYQWLLSGQSITSETSSAVNATTQHREANGQLAFTLWEIGQYRQEVGLGQLHKKQWIWNMMWLLRGCSFSMKAAASE